MAISFHTARFRIGDVIRNKSYTHMLHLVAGIQDGLYVLVLLEAENDSLPDGWTLGGVVKPDVDIVDGVGEFVRRATKTEYVLYIQN